MIDILTEKIISGLNTELGLNSTYYRDHLVMAVSNRSLNVDHPGISISVIEGESVPTDFQIASRISQTEERYRIQVHILVRAAEELSAKTERRIVTQRVKRAFMRKDGEIFNGILQAEDSDVGYSERPKKYAISRTLYDNNEIQGVFLYMSLLEVEITTDVNYTQ